MKHVCGEQGTGNREGGEADEEDEGKKEWGGEGLSVARFPSSTGDLQSDAVSRLSPQCPLAAQAERTQKGGTDTERGQIL